MSTKALAKQSEFLPSVFNDFFKPWNEWFDNGGSLWGREITAPSVNVSENTKEYNYSSFSRSFTLPDAVNKEKIEANYENGVLQLVLPKTEETKKITAKHIAVK